MVAYMCEYCVSIYLVQYVYIYVFIYIIRMFPHLTVLSPPPLASLFPSGEYCVCIGWYVGKSLWAGR